MHDAPIFQKVMRQSSELLDGFDKATVLSQMRRPQAFDIHEMTHASENHGSVDIDHDGTPAVETHVNKNRLTG
jgi:hypothetical protein